MNIWLLVFIAVIAFICIAIFMSSYRQRKKTGGSDSPFDISSGRQIPYIVANGNSTVFFTLLQLLSKHMKANAASRTQLVAQLNKARSDSEIYDFIEKYRPPAGTSDKSSRNVPTYTMPISGLVKVEPTAKYLDIGCGSTCEKTLAAGRALKIPIEQIYGTDVRQWAEKDHAAGTRSIQFKYIEEDGRLPFGDGEFDIVSYFMVLHHIADLPASLAEARRVLKPGGLMIVKEHDAANKFDHILADIEHRLYAGEQLPADYYGRYRSRQEWEQVMSDNGFQITTWAFPAYAGRTTITPTRAYFAVFQKID